jgi:hypothetical protein
MNYCSIEDAWGRENCMSGQIKEYMTNTNYVEPDNTQSNQNIKLSSSVDYKVESNIVNDEEKHQIEIENCGDIVIHIKKCPKCYGRMKEHFRPHFKSQIIEKFQDIVDDNRDIIVLILIGTSIVLFFNLINNITTQKN